MSKVSSRCLLALVAALLIVPAVVAEEDEGQKRLSFDGDVRARWEYLENFTDFMDANEGEFRDNFDFFPYRVRIGVRGEFGKNVSAYVAFQNQGAFGDKDARVEATPEDPVYQSYRGDWFSNNTVLYEGFIDVNEIGGTDFSVRIGRQEHVLGNELLLGDGDFYNGRSFDGIRATIDKEIWDLDGFFYEIQERDVLPGILDITEDLGEEPNGGSDDTTLTGVTAGFDIGESGQRVTPYVLFSRNGNEDPVIPKLSFYTIGAQYGRPADDGNTLDWSVEAAIQTGDMSVGGNEMDISASVLEGWIGVSFGSGSRHRFHAGVLRLSDGDDPTEQEAFIPLYGDTHDRAGLADIFSEWSASFAQAGDSRTLHNLTDIDVGWDWTAGAHEVTVAYHMFTATEDAHHEGEDDIGSEIDLLYRYEYSDNLGFEAGVASFEPGDVYGPADDSVLRGWAQAWLRF